MFSCDGHDCISMDAISIMANWRYIYRFTTKKRNFGDQSSHTTISGKNKWPMEPPDVIDTIIMINIGCWSRWSGVSKLVYIVGRAGGGRAFPSPSLPKTPEASPKLPQILPKLPRLSQIFPKLPNPPQSRNWSIGAFFLSFTVLILDAFFSL